MFTLQSCQYVKVYGLYLNWHDFIWGSWFTVSSNNTAFYVVMEADAGIQNQTILQDYIVPLNFIERWGNAMGILGSFLYKVTFFIIFLLFLR